MPIRTYSLHLHKTSRRRICSTSSSSWRSYLERWPDFSGLAIARPVRGGSERRAAPLSPLVSRAKELITNKADKNYNGPCETEGAQLALAFDFNPARLVDDHLNLFPRERAVRRFRGGEDAIDDLVGRRHVAPLEPEDDIRSAGHGTDL